MAIEPATWGRRASNSGDQDERLGLDQPVGWWPATARLKSYEAAGFRHLQVRMPARGLLSDHALLTAHASRLRERLAFTGLRLILHAPDELLAGSVEHDRQLDGALGYAEAAGSDLIVYHGARIPLHDKHVQHRLAAEKRSLRRVARRAGELGIRIAVENLAPVYPGAGYVSHNPAAVAALVDELDSAQVGMCLDLGHAHITADAANRDLTETVEPLLDRVILFHVHDNFGARPFAPRAGGIEPLRLDLHLAPGAGSLPWRALAPLLGAHPAPLQLEVHPAQRPEPARMAVVMRELLGLGARVSGD
jgi:sugar phosphate isomerase/epimerase